MYQHEENRTESISVRNIIDIDGGKKLILYIDEDYYQKLARMPTSTKLPWTTAYAVSTAIIGAIRRDYLEHQPEPEPVSDDYGIEESDDRRTWRRDEE